ncbi:TonB-dependent receptor [Novosphingobium sp. 1949]|uniref:TonB-dependent receptor n=1 Tax=Novosphingobium organovorum TaxID=2930092 RepID=A0ABT0BGE0_9SPHN|nr:TonB-dependent receptor [Novosphingobium organovorum]MCJ2184099.1 TonB-dependent receptor [Novosphingobium organovorum]
MKSSVFFLAGAGLAALTVPLCAQAKEADGTAAEIVVTATRRSERLIDAPQSVTAVTAQDLSKLNATKFSDFANTVPGLQFTTQGPGSTSITMRGVTAGADIGATVGIYVDDVPYGSSSSFAKAPTLALDAGLYDLQRVEVLRGPQGTLYGSASMGGVLKYVTNLPSLTEFGGSAQVGVGTIHDGATDYNVAATVNSPIVTDKVAVRATGFYSRTGGFIDNLYSGQKNVDRSEIYGGRVDVLLQPVDDLSIRLTGFGQNISRDGMLYGEYTLDGDAVNGALDQDHPLDEGFNSKFRMVSGTVSYDFDVATLVSVTSYQWVRNAIQTDYSSLYAPILQSIGLDAYGVSFPDTERTDKFTQEVRLASASEKPIEWLVGGFYTHETSESHQVLYAYDADFLPITSLNLADAYIPSTYEEYAAFGDVTIHLTSALAVTGGLRYAHNNQTFEQIATGLLLGSAAKRKSSESVVTYLANGRYAISPNVNAYVRFATGYRPGGPNYQAVDPVTGNNLAKESYESDSLKSYEAGIKAETPDHTFGIDASVYFIDWKNIQIATAVSGISVIANGGAAHIKGAELTLTGRPDGNLMVTGAFAYNDAYLTEDVEALGAVSGDRLPNSAHFTSTINADWTYNASDLKPSLGGTLRYVGKRNASFDLNTGFPQYNLPDYVVVDLRAGFTLGPVETQLYVHNLFDVRGQLSANTSSAAYGGPARISLLQPRTIGISATTRF